MAHLSTNFREGIGNLGIGCAATQFTATSPTIYGTASMLSSNSNMQPSMELVGHRPTEIHFLLLHMTNFLPFRLSILLIESLRFPSFAYVVVVFANVEQINTSKIKCSTIYSCRLSQLSVYFRFFFLFRLLCIPSSSHTRYLYLSLLYSLTSIRR